MKIDVTDDVPTAHDDANAVPTGSYDRISGDVVANDVKGADGA